MPQPNEIDGKRHVDCWHHMDLLWACARPLYQFNVYYRTGDFDSCDEFVDDVKKCASAKVKSDRVEAEEIMKEISYKKRQGDANPSKAIWEFKDQPCWGTGQPKTKQYV